MPQPEAVVPQFVPLDQLKHGAPLNVNKTFKGYTVRAAILKVPKLALAAKAVWIMLVDQCYVKGYTDFSERQLAQCAGLSLSQVKRHLRKLIKVELLHAERRTGGENRFWLVHHPVYAFCDPLPQVTYDLPPRSHMTYPQVTYDPLSLVEFMDKNGLRPQTGAVGTGSVLSGRRNHEDNAPPPNQPENSQEASETESAPTLGLLKEARSFWYSLSRYEKTKRHSQAISVGERILHFRQYLSVSDPAMKEQAKSEVKRASEELRDLGFYLTALDAKGKPPQPKMRKANA